MILEKKSERGIKAILLICGFSAAIFVFFIILFLIINGAPAFTEIGLTDFFFGTEWHPTWTPPSWGVAPIIIGTLLVTLGAMVIAVPIGIGGAIFISQLAPSRIKRYLKTAIELLAGIPSIVFGFFGLLVLTQWLRISFNLLSGSCWLAGSIILAIMSLPTIITVAEDAITAVPITYKEASLAIGATKWQTIRRIIVPAARSGIITAIILGIGRAIGETMAVMMVTGNQAILPQPLTNIFSPIRPITATLALEMGEVSWGSTHYHALFALAIVLFIIVLIINSVATILIRKRVQTYKEKPENRNKSREVLYKIKITVKFAVYVITISAFLFLSCLTFLSNLDLPQLSLIFLLIVGIAIGIFAIFKFILKVSLLYSILIFILFWVLWTWFGIMYTFLIICISLGIYLLFKFVLSAKIIQRIAFSFLTISILIVGFSLGVVISFIVINGASALNWQFLTEGPKDLGRAGGIFPAIIGTILLAGGALLVGGVLGILAGVYLSEYSREGKINKIIRTGMDNLNGTPSIVFGLFGFTFFVIYLNFGVCLLAGQLTLGIMILPTITRTTEEAVKAVPNSFREGSLALGATKWQTTYKVVLPAAAPGIITGLILGLGRATGETAPILFVATVFSQRFITLSPFDPVMALPTHLYTLVTGVPNSEVNAYGTALVLLLLVLVFYAIAAVLRSRYQQFKKW